MTSRHKQRADGPIPAVIASAVIITSFVFPRFCPAQSVPVASSQSVSVVENGQRAITLSGSVPNGEPAAYQITALPQFGVLYDENISGHEIAQGDLPYTLKSGTGNNVTYVPGQYSRSQDNFQFDTYTDAALAQGVTNVIGGIDSLTNVYSYLVNDLAPQLQATYGNGGPGYQGFYSETASVENVSYSYTGSMQYLYDLNPATPPASYAFNRLGVDWASGSGSDSFNWDPLKKWDTCTLFYLQQPGGGTFRFGLTGASPNSYISGNTNGTVNLVSQTITSPGEATTSISINQITGNVVLFGALFKMKSGGIMVSTVGRGGQSFAQIMAADPNFNSLWWSPQGLGPCLYLFNGGTNDRTTTTGPQFQSEVTTLVNRIQAADSQNRVLLIKPNETYDEYQTYASSYTAALQNVASSNGVAFQNNATVLGPYATAVANGDMFDEVHPNAIGESLIANSIYSDLTAPASGTPSAAAAVTLNISPINHAPTIDTVSNLTMGNAQQGLAVPLSGISDGIGDSGQSIAISAHSSNESLLPDPQAVYQCPGSTGELLLTPSATGTGTAQVTVTVTDNGGTANGGADTTTETFTVTVVASTLPPTINTPAGLTMSYWQPQLAVALTGISPGPGQPGPVTLSAVSSNPGLLTVNGLAYTSPSSTGQLLLQPTGAGIGAAQVTVTACNGGSNAYGGINATSVTFQVLVQPTPSLGTVANQTVVLPGNTGPLNVNVGGAEGDALGLTGTSSNQAIVPNGAILVGGTAAAPTVTVTPAAVGTATITLTATDPLTGLSASTTFLVTVEALPSVATIANQTVVLPGNTGGLPFSVGGAGGDALTVTASSSNPAVVPSSGITLGGSATAPTVTVTPAAVGSATITLTVTDPTTTLATTTSFTVTAEALPVIGPIANQNVSLPGSTGTLMVTLGGAGGDPLTLSAASSNSTIVPGGAIVLGGTPACPTVTVTPASTGSDQITLTATDPATGLSASTSFWVNAGTVSSLTSIPNQTVVLPGNTGPLPVVMAGGGGDALTVTATSGNQTVVPSGGITIGGTSANPTVTVTPSCIGSADISLAVTDTTAGTSGSVTFTVMAEALPAIAPVANQTVVLPGNTGALALSLGGAGGDELVVTGGSSNLAVVPSGGIVMGGTAANPTVTVTPATFGSTTITLTVTDPATGLTANTSFAVTAEALPTIASVPNQTVILPGNSGALALTVGGAGGDALTVSAASNNATVVPSGALSVGGTAANPTLTITPAATGFANITVTVTDPATGLTASTAFPVAAGMLPVIGSITNQTVVLPGNTGALSLALSGAGGDPLNLTVTSSNLAVVPGAGIALGGSIANPTVTVTPAAVGTANITLTATDPLCGLSATTTFGVTAQALPVISGIPNQTVVLPGNSGPLAFSIGGAGGDTLTLAASSSNSAVVPGSGITLAGTGGSKTVTVTPSALGVANITLTATDPLTGLSTTTVFTVTAEVPPTIGSIANQLVAFPGNTGAIPLAVFDPAGDPLTWSAVSSNEGVVLDNGANDGISFGGTGISPTAVVTPASTGSATVTLTVTDTLTGLTASSSFTVTSGTAPAISSISNQSAVIPGNTGPISVTVSDAATPAAQLTLTVTSSNLSVVPASGMVLGGSSAARTITVTPVATGASAITVTVTDALGLSNSTTFTVFGATAASPGLSIGNVTVTVGPTGNQYASFPVSLSPAPSSPVTMNYTTVDGSATAGTDYTAQSGTFSLAAGATLGYIKVLVTAGTTDSTGLSFSTVLSQPKGAQIVNGTGIGTILHDSNPICLSATPSPAVSVVGNPLTLTTTYSAVGGPGNMASTSLCIGNLSSPSTSLYVKYQPGTNLLYVANASGTYVGGFAPGSNNVISTTAGTLNCAATTVTRSGNQLVVGWSMSPGPVLIGTHPCYLIVSDVFGLSSGWQSLGFWTVADANPTAVSVTPSILSSPVGQAETLTSTYNVPAGISNLNSAGITVGFGPAATTLYAKYSPSTNLLYLANASGVYAGGYTPGSSNVISVPGGSLNCAQTTVTANGNQLVVGWNFTPTGTLIGTQNTYLIVSDLFGLSSGWQQLATWTVTDAPPVSSSVSPTSLLSAVNQAESLTATYSSALGAANLTGAAICAGPENQPANSLSAKYDAVANLLYLTDANDNLTGGFAPGSNNVITTSQGSLNCASTSVIQNGNQLIVNWNLSPASAVTGAQTVYGDASDIYGESSGWTPLGLWNITTSPVAAINNIEAFVGPGGTPNATFTVSISPAPQAPVTLNYATANGTAIAGTDYTAESGTMTFAAGVNSATISVPVTTNPSEPAGLTFQTVISNPVNAQLGISTGTCTFTRTPAPTIGTVANQKVVLPGNSGALPVAIGGAGGDPLTVTASSSAAAVVPGNGIAIGGTQASPTVTITPAAAGLATITLTATDPTTGFSASTTFTVTAEAGPTIANPGNQTVAFPSGTGALAISVGGAGGDALTLTASSNNQTVVPNAAINVGGTVANPTVTITPAAFGSASITLTATDPATGLSASTTFTLTSAAGVSVGNTTIVAATSGTQNAVFTVSLSAAPASTVTVNYATANGTASAGTDYTAKSGSVSFAAGVSTATISVPVQGGTTDASGLTFQLALSNASGAQIVSGTGICTILHDATPVCVSVTPATLSSLAGTPEVLTTTYSSVGGLANVSTAALCVGKLSTPATSLYLKYLPGTNTLYMDNASGVYIGGFAPGSNNVISTTLGSLNCAATSVTQNGNQIVIAWSITPGPGLIGSQADDLLITDGYGLTSGWQQLGTWTVTTAPPVSVSVNPGTLTSSYGLPQTLTTISSSTEGASAISSIAACVGQLNAASTSLYLKYQVSTNLLYLTNASNVLIGGFAPGSNNVISTALGNLNCAQTTVTENGNLITIGWNITPASTLVGAQNVYLDSSDIYGLSSGWQNLGKWTINTTATASIDNTTVSVGPSGSQNAIFTVALSPTPASAGTLAYTTVNGSATAGVDYTAQSGTLNIAAGATSATISVPVPGGTTDASGLTFQVVLSNPVNLQIGTGTGTCTITHLALPTIAGLANQTVVLPGNTGPLAVTVGGAGGDALTLTGSSANPAVVPNGAIVIGGTAANPTVTVTPAAAGSALITLTATDPVTALSASTSFTVTAEAVPMIGTLANQTVAIPGNTGALAVTVGGAGGDALTLTGSSSNQAAVPNSAIVIGGTAANPTVCVTPAAAGSAVITLTVTDPATGLTATTGFTVNAEAVPTIGSLANQTVVLPGSTGPLAVTVGGAGGDALTLTGSSANPAVVPNGAIVIGGTAANPTVCVTPTAAGSALITLTASDPVTALSVSTSFTVTAEAVPMIGTLANQTVVIPGNTGALAVTVGGAGGDALTLTGSSGNQAAVPNSAIVIGGTAANPTVCVTPAAAGLAVITLTVTDPATGLTATTGFTVNAEAVPTIGSLANQTVVLPGSTGALAVTVGGAGGDALTLTGSSANPAVVPNGAIVIGGTAANPTVTVTPAAAGTAVITLTATDPATGLSASTPLSVTGLSSTSPGVSIGNTAVIVGPTGSQNAVFTVTLNPVPTVGVSVTYATANGTASAGTDYTAKSGTLNFVAGSTSATINVPVTGGTSDASGLTFQMVLSKPVNAQLAGGIGTCTITHDSVPLVIGVTPTPAASQVGSANLLTTTFSAVGGPTNMSSVAFCVGKLSTAATSLYLKYIVGTNALYLANASGTYIGGFAPGSNNVITTALGSLDCSKTTVARNGNQLAVAWSITPAAGLIGTDNDYLIVSDNFGLSSGWQQLGVWTIAPAPPLVVSVAPTPAASAAGAAQVLTTTYSDLTGTNVFTSTGLCVGNLGTASTSLYAKYAPNTNLLYLANAAGTYVGGFAPGSSNVITTTLGSLDCSKTTVSTNGNQLAVTWSITPTTSLLGSQAVYLIASDTYGLSSGWQKLGAWTISALPFASVNNAAVTVGASGTQNATFTVTLTTAPVSTVTLSYATVNGTASAGTDYTPENGTLAFAPGVTTANVTVPVLGGASDASGLTFQVVLGNPVNVQIGTGTGTCVITHRYPPTLGGIANQTMVLPGSIGPLNVAVGGAGGDALTLTASSSNPSVIASGAIVVGGTAANPSLGITGSAAGTATITLIATDPSTGLAASTSFTVTVEAPPTLAGMANQTVVLPGGTGALAVSIGGAGGDALTLTGSSNNQSVVPNGAISIGGTTANPTVAIVPAAVGSATITLTVTDPTTGLTASTAFTVKAQAAPAIAGPANQTVVLPGNTGVLPVSVGGAGGDALTVTGSSNNPAVVPNGAIVIGGTAANPTVTVTPSGAGTALLTLTATDPATGLTATTVFTVTAEALPSIAGLPNQTVVLPGNTGALPIVIGGAGGDALTLTGSSSNTAVVPGSAIAIGGTAANPTVTVTPASAGTAKITLTVTDPATGLSAATTFSVVAESPAFGGIAITNTSVVAALSGTQTAVFTVTLTPAPTSTVTVGYATANGTASAGTDYTPKSGTLSFAAGVSSATISVPVQGGTTDASGLTFQMVLSNSVNAQIVTGTGTCTIEHESAPLCVSVAPSPATSAVSTPFLLTTTFSAAGGPGNMTAVGVNVGKLSTAATSLYAKYAPATNLLYLANSSGTYIGGFAPGSANVIATALGTLDCSKTTVTRSGNQLMVAWSITPYSPLIGAQNLYLLVSDIYGLNSGWQQLGAWTITASAPVAVSISPSPLVSQEGRAEMLTSTFNCPDGPANITAASVNIGKLSTAATSLYAKYVPATNTLYLANSSGTYAGGFTPGSANVISTGLGSLDCSKTTVTVTGNQLVIGWCITPGTSLIGAQNDYLIASDSYGLSSGWQQLGTWTIGPSSPSS